MWIVDTVAEVRARIVAALDAGSLRARFAKGAFWSLIGAAIAQGLTLLASIVTARLLGKVSFGELGMVQSTVGMFGVFAGFGLGLTATKHVAELRTTNPDRAGRIIGLSAIVAAVCGGAISFVLYAIAPMLATRTINAPHLATELRIGCGLLLLNALNGTQMGALAGLEAFKAIAKASFARGLLSFPILIAGVWFWGLRGAVGAMVAVAAVGWFINHLALRVECRRASVKVRYSGILPEWPVLWKFSLPAFLSSAMVAPITWAVRTILVNRPEGYVEMGIFTAAYQWQITAVFLGRTFGAVLLPMISSTEGSNNPRLQRMNILLSWMLGCLVVFPVLCFPEIVVLLYGGKFQGTAFAETLVLVMFFTSVMSYKAGLARVLAARDLLWWGFLSNLVWGAILLCAGWLMRAAGAVGLAGSFALAYVLNTAVFLPFYLRRELVPKETLISPQVGVIWSTLIVIGLASGLGLSLYVRVGLIVLGLVASWKAFGKLVRKAGIIAPAER
jgi:O-antigen/teichoic acid export membrane protein